MKAVAPFALAALLLGGPVPGAAATRVAPDTTATAQPWRYAPADSTLDAQASGWTGRRRTMALIILGSTFVAGAAASVLRRRSRRDAGPPTP